MARILRGLNHVISRSLHNLKLIIAHSPVHSEYEGVYLVDRYTYFRYKYLRLPKKYKEHRRFFSSQKRGFGEDAFHSVWREIFLDYKPKCCLEIGVYRGQTISLWKMLQMEIGIDGFIQGLTPLSSMDDSVSDYLDIDYRGDILANFNQFNLGAPNIVEGLSTDLKVQSKFSNYSYDLIYIDGGHDYETVLNDYRFAVKLLKNGGLVCFDDSSLYFQTEGKFKGHPGPSAVVTQFAIKELNYLFTAGHLNFFRKMTA